MTRKRAASVPSSLDEAAWSLEANPALRELLDHIARQLAEYVRLIKQAAGDEVRAEPADEDGGQ